MDDGILIQIKVHTRQALLYMYLDMYTCIQTYMNT